MKVRAHGLHRVLASHAIDSVEYWGGGGGGGGGGGAGCEPRCMMLKAESL